jgi:hypothetical protein
MWSDLQWYDVHNEFYESPSVGLKKDEAMGITILLLLFPYRVSNYARMTSFMRNSNTVS